MNLGIQGSDEFVHQLGNFAGAHESFNFELYDSSARLGALIRMHSRGADGTLEVIVACFLPDGRTALSKSSGPMDLDDVFGACGVNFDLVRPLEEVVLSFKGPARIIEDSLTVPELWDFAHASDALGPADGHIDLSLTFTSAVPPLPFGQAVSAPSGRASNETAGAYQIFGRAIGHISVGSNLWLVDVNSVRSHSWDAKPVTRDLPHHWITASFGPTLSVSAYSHGPQEANECGGFVWDGTSIHPASRLRINTSWSGSNSHPDVIELSVKTLEAELNLSGKVIYMLPTQGCSPDGGVNRILLGIVRWNLKAARVGYGIVKYEDSMMAPPLNAEKA